jgi:hypothetical protein
MQKHTHSFDLLKNNILMKKLIVSLLLISGIGVFAGIYRHDVPSEDYLALGKQSQFDCVGSVFDYKHNANAGSCVLIGDRYVLSAAHIFMESDFKKKKVKMNGSTISVKQPVRERVADITEFTFRFNKQRSFGKVLHIYPVYLDENQKHQCDIALIELAEPITSAVPMKLNITMDELGAIVTGVGYGASGIASKPETVEQWGEKVAGENTIDKLEGFLLNGNRTLLVADFDHPQDTSCNKMGSAQPLPLEYICSGGDSGGGLFRKTGNGWELVGITSGGGVDIQQFFKTGYYGQVGKWTRVSVFHEWITSLMQQSNGSK